MTPTGNTSHHTFMELLKFGDAEGAIREAIGRGSRARAALVAIREEEK